MNMPTEKQRGKKLKSMLKVDFRRMFTMPLVYIMIGVCFVMPILILVMTTMVGDPSTGKEAAMESFTNVWQAIGSVSGSAMGMDLTSMCNINLLYFLSAVFVCIFVADDFRSGYAKNLFTVRARKSDYVVSKTLVTFVSVVIMFLAYFVGAMIGGAIAGLSFDLGTAGVSGVVFCMVSKIFLALIFISIGVAVSSAAKQKLWLSILCSCAADMLLFTMIPMIAPLDATLMNVVLCVAGSGLFAVGLGAVSNLILNKTNLV